jgi:cyanophycin synthetase
LISHAGRVAARGFHRLIIREDRHLRGRDRGVVAQLLCDAARQEAPETDCEIVLDESEALHHAVRTMQSGEVVVVFYEKLEPLRRVLENYAAQPVQSIDNLSNLNTRRRIGAVATVSGRRPLLQLAQARRPPTRPHL